MENRRGEILQGIPLDLQRQRLECACEECSVYQVELHGLLSGERSQLC